MNYFMPCVGSDLPIYYVTPLIFAIKLGRIEIVKYLVENGVDIEIIDLRNKTALDHACISNNLEIVKYLLDRGAKIKSLKRDALKSFPLEKGRTDLVKLLLEYSLMYSDLLNECKHSLLLNYAICDKRLDLIKELIKNGADPNNKLIRNRTPLMHICDVYDQNSDSSSNSDPNSNYNSYRDIIKYLLDNGAYMDRYCGKGERGADPLMYACIKGNIDLVKIFIENGVDPNSKSMGMTPLLYLCRYGRRNVNDIIMYLLDHGADVNIRSSSNHDSLMYACIHGKVNLVRILASYSPVFNKKDGRNMLMYACGSLNFELIKMLVEEYKMDINDRDDKGRTAIMHIYYYTYETTTQHNTPYMILKYLLEQNADPFVKDNYGRDLIGYIKAEHGGHINKCVEDIIIEYQNRSS
jgi:ankyrin repeat protein